MKSIFAFVMGLFAVIPNVLTQSNQYILLKNDSIPKCISQEIYTKINVLLDCIIDVDKERFKEELASDTLRSRLPEIELHTQFEFAKNLYDGNGYKIMSEYYSPAIDSSTDIKIYENKGTDYEYYLDLGIGRLDTYISLFTINDGRMLFGLIFRKFDPEWRIGFIGFNAYSIYGKVAIDFYKSALDCYKQNYIADATLDMLLAEKLLRPNTFFRYSLDEEITKFNERIQAIIGAQYKFPISVEEIYSEPLILGISPVEINDTILFCVQYQSKINLSKSKKLANENKKLQNIIGDIFYGFDKNKDSIMYAVINDNPLEIVTYIQKFE